MNACLLTSLLPEYLQWTGLNPSLPMDGISAIL